MLAGYTYSHVPSTTETATYDCVSCAHLLKLSIPFRKHLKNSAMCISLLCNAYVINLPYKSGVFCTSAVCYQNPHVCADDVCMQVDASVPLFGYIGRLEEQKGVDILIAALPKALQAGNIQVAILGTGQQQQDSMTQCLT